MQHIGYAATTLALALALGACVQVDSESMVGPDFGVLDASGSLPEDVRVYTQNMFLGGDTGPLFTLPLTDPTRIGEVIAATSRFYFAEVLQSDIPGRTAEFVDEIDLRRPHVVALQEAVGYATGTLDPATFAFNPTAAGPDLLASLMSEISARELPYDIAVVRPASSIALPLGPPNADGLFPALGVQDRVVLLVHDDIEDYETASGLYQARIPLGPVEIVRGWVRLSVERNGASHHFVGTHLETQGSGPADPVRQVHEGQAFELQNAVLAGLEGNVVLLGDLNSDAAAGPGAPSWTPTYGNLVGAGFLDVWQAAPRGGSNDGTTCCLEAGRALDERIDFVLVRPGDGSATNGDDGDGLHRGFYQVEIVGTDISDQTAGGLWPSDHAGIVASIRPPGTAP